MNIQQAKSLKILLIGDSCIDTYHYGACDRLSGEAPVPIFLEIDWESRNGMALNVYLNLKAFNLDVTCHTNDKKLEKHRYIDEKTRQHLLRVDKNENFPVNAYKVDSADFIDIDLVVISDYNKGFLTHDTCKEIAEICKQKNLPLFVDSKKKDLSCFEGAILKINQKEHSTIVEYPKNHELIVTMGAAGCVYKNKIYRTKKVEVFDVCGAGDVFLASLVYKYMKHGSIEKTLDFANKAAAHSVTKLGTYVLTKEDVESLCMHKERGAT